MQNGLICALRSVTAMETVLAKSDLQAFIPYIQWIPDHAWMTLGS